MCIDNNKFLEYDKKNGHFDTKNNYDPSPWDSTAIFIFSSHFLIPSLKQCIFSEFSWSSPPPTLYKVETLKKFWIHTSNIVCGVRGGVGPV